MSEAIEQEKDQVTDSQPQVTKKHLVIVKPDENLAHLTEKFNKVLGSTDEEFFELLFEDLLEKIAKNIESNYEEYQNFRTTVVKEFIKSYLMSKQPVVEQEDKEEAEAFADESAKDLIGFLRYLARHLSEANLPSYESKSFSYAGSFRDGSVILQLTYSPDRSQ